MGADRGHFADRLCSAIERTGTPACVGLDPVVERLPRSIIDESNNEADAIERFSAGVIDAVAGLVPAVKLQSACYERWGSTGFATLERVSRQALSKGLLVILDAKRGDIGVSAGHYASAAFGAIGADAVTVSAYMGPDTVDPFLAPGYADRGVFALVRTSNPGSDSVQSRRLEDGRTVAQMIADHVATLGERSIGERGYSSVGAVVAATKPDDAAALRKRMPHQVFLVPGYGAQGGTAETVRALFNGDGMGALVTASRSVIYGFGEGDADWTQGVRRAAAGFVAELNAI
ncbi:MAG: orotidine-5'-phosphate decarboxylase [Phycisphaeraceae bacterium]|nr:orotidine-5'-phosphate decarboxylase [Phycisphaeraceae bacterium]